MTAILHLVVTGLLCLGMVPLLARARWPVRAPGTAITLWQSVMLTLFLCVVGMLYAWGLDPYPGNLTDGFSLAVSALLEGTVTRDLDAGHLVALFAGTAAVVILLVAALISCAALGRTRRRHRRLIDLVAHGDPAAPGAAVLQHSAPVAYCVPGLRPHVVISTGALDLLDGQQVRAVLAHERAHARARHDLVLLPFTLLERLVPRCGLLAQASDAVSGLVEMCADDEARRQVRTVLSGRTGAYEHPPRRTRGRTQHQRRRDHGQGGPPAQTTSSAAHRRPTARVRRRWHADFHTVELPRLPCLKIPPHRAVPILELTAVSTGTIQCRRRSFREDRHFERPLIRDLDLSLHGKNKRAHPARNCLKSRTNHRD